MRHDNQYSTVNGFHVLMVQNERKKELLTHYKADKHNAIYKRNDLVLHTHERPLHVDRKNVERTGTNVLSILNKEYVGLYFLFLLH